METNMTDTFEDSGFQFNYNYPLNNANDPLAYDTRAPLKPDPGSYKYNEGELLREITEYINKTYGEHYSQNNYQATEFIIDGGHGIGFTVGNILKYAQRYGHKGTPADWRKDMMKVIHYAVIALYVHDLENNKEV